MATKKYVSEKQRKIRLVLIALVVTVALVAVGIIGAHLYSNYLKSGADQRKEISFESEHYKVNNCMMTYFYLSDFYNVYNTNGVYFSYMGLDPFKPMQDQIYDEEQGTTWYDYFVNNSANNVQGYLYYAEAALENGYEAEDLDKLVDKQIDNLKKSAEDQEITLEEYIANVFGTGINEDDIRDALELQVYASEYYNHVEDEYKNSLTDEDYETYYADNKNSYDKVDYRSYAINADVAEDADEAAKATATEAAAAKAEELLAAATDGEAFAAWVAADLAAKNEGLEEDKVLSEEEITTQATEITEAAAYTEGDDFSEWAFDSARAVGDTTIIDDGAGNYTVYRLEATVYRQEDATRDVRHILLTADTYGSDEEASAKAEEILNEYLAGDKTEDAFEALAEEYNEDSGSLYEDVSKGDMVAEFENWLFDEARVTGDTDVVKTEYGYHIMYYVGEGQAKWQNDVYDALLEAYVNELVEGYQETYTVEYEYHNIYSLPTTIPESAFKENEAAEEGADTEDTEEEHVHDDSEDEHSHDEDTADDTGSEDTVAEENVDSEAAEDSEVTE